MSPRPGKGCQVEGCVKPHHAQGFCRSHYYENEERPRDPRYNPAVAVASASRDDWLDFCDPGRWHPAAKVFPVLGEDALDRLAADISENGLQFPVVLHDGLVLDGRNRLLACGRIDHPPHFTEWSGENGTPLRFVVSVNLHRRHLTSSQRAALSLDVLPMLEAEARDRQGTRTDLTSVKDLTEVQRAADQAAELFDTNRQYINDARNLRDEAPEIYEEVRAGETTIPRARRDAGMDVHYSSDSPEWNTPSDVIERVQKLGDIDLDPCSNSKETPNVAARVHFTKDDDGLAQTWSGFVYMNPPYGRVLPEWISKLVAEYEDGEVTQAIALVPARTDTAWFRKLRDYPRCFVSGRLKFSISDNGAPFPSMVVYLGTRRDEFLAAFDGLGDIFERVSE